MTACRCPDSRCRRRGPCSILLVSVVVAAVAMGCGNPSERAGEQQAESPVGASPYQRTPIELPLDEYRLDPEDQALLEYAFQLGVQRCMEREGYDWPVPEGPLTPMPINHRRYGVADVVTAQEAGYHLTTPPDQVQSAETIDAAMEDLSDAGRRTLWGEGSGDSTDGCVARTNYDLGVDQETLVGLADQLSAQSLDESVLTPEVRAAFDAWSRCMAEQGFDYESPQDAIGDPRWWDGSTGTDVADVSSTEIETATADVRCKDDTELVDVWMDVETAIQDELIAENRVELEALRSHQDEIMTEVQRAI